MVVSPLIFFLIDLKMEIWERRFWSLGDRTPSFRTGDMFQEADNLFPACISPTQMMENESRELTTKARSFGVNHGMV